MSYTMALPRNWPDCRNIIRRRANETLTDQSAIPGELLEFPLGDRFRAAEQTHGQSAARAGNSRSAFTVRLADPDHRREHRVHSAEARGGHHRRVRNGRSVPPAERAAELLSRTRLLRCRRRKLCLALPGAIYRNRRYGRGRRGRIHLERVLRRLSSWKASCALRRKRRGLPRRFADAAIRSVEARPLHERQPAVLARLSISL